MCNIKKSKSLVLKQKLNREMLETTGMFSGGLLPVKSL